MLKDHCRSSPSLPAREGGQIVTSPNESFPCKREWEGGNICLQPEDKQAAPLVPFPTIESH